MSLLWCLVPYQLDDALQVRCGLRNNFTNDLHKGDGINDIADSKSCGVWQQFPIAGTNIITKSHLADKKGSDRSVKGTYKSYTYISS